MTKEIVIEEERIQLAGRGQVDEQGEFEVLLITAGKGNGWNFSQEVLKEAVDNQVFEGIECFVDHSIWGHSVRDLGGVFHATQWDGFEQGVSAKLRTSGPSGPLVKALGQEMVSDEEPKPKVGFSADILITVDTDKNVTNILRAFSVDLVFDPARGGAFKRALNSIQKGEQTMETNEIEIVEEATQPSIDASVEEGLEAMRNLLQVQKEQEALANEAEAAREVRMEMCSLLLESALAAAKLPTPMLEEIRKRFEGTIFEPGVLQKDIENARELVSELQAGTTIEGIPGLNMRVFNSTDRLQAVVDDLLDAPREV